MTSTEKISNIFLKYHKIQEFAQIVLLLMIILLAFSTPFGWQVGRKIINNMIYVWILTLNFRYIYYFIKNNKIVLYLLFLFIWISLSSFVVLSVDHENYNMFVKYFFLPILIIITSIKKEHIRYLISAFLIGMFINELISYGIYFGYIKGTFLGFNLHGDHRNPVPFLSTHIQYTVYLSFAIVLSLFTFFNTKQKGIKILVAIFTVTMIINIFLTIGRTGQFSLLMTSLFLIVIYFRHNIKYIIYSLITIIIVFVLAFNFSSNANSRLKQGYDDLEKVIKQNNYETGWGIRLSSYVIIPDIIKSEKFNLFYGMGYCEVNNIIMDIQLKKYGSNSKFTETFGYLHNTYISMLAGTGFVGFILFLIFWVYILIIKVEDEYLSFVRYSIWFIITFQSFSNELFWQHEIMLLSAVFISIIIYVSTKDYEEKFNE